MKETRWELNQRQYGEQGGSPSSGEWFYEPDDEGSSMGWISRKRDGLPPEQLFEVLGDSGQQAGNADFVVEAVMEKKRREGLK